MKWCCQLDQEHIHISSVLAAIFVPILLIQVVLQPSFLLAILNHTIQPNQGFQSVQGIQRGQKRLSV